MFDFGGLAAISRKLLLQSFQQGVAQQFAAMRIGFCCISAAEIIDRLRAFAGVEQDFALQTQRIGIGRIRRQSPLDFSSRRVQLIKNVHSLVTLRNHAAFVADQVARHEALAGLGKVDYFAFTQVDRGHFGRIQGQKIAIAAHKTPATGHRAFRQGNYPALPARFPVGQANSLHLMPSRQNHFALMYACRIHVVLPFVFPSQLAVDEVQAVQRVGVDGRDQNSAVGNAHAGVDCTIRRTVRRLHKRISTSAPFDRSGFRVRSDSPITASG